MLHHTITDIIGRRGSRRVSIGALAGMSVLNLDSNIGSLSSGSSTAKLGGLRIRNKAIPIINPLVKNPNWPSTIAPHKKGKVYICVRKVFKLNNVATYILKHW